MEAKNRGGIWLSYRPARLHRLKEFIPWLHKRLKIRALTTFVGWSGSYVRLYGMRCVTVTFTCQGFHKLRRSCGDKIYILKEIDKKICREWDLPTQAIFTKKYYQHSYTYMLHDVAG
jgi:hypothetical protein